MFRATILTGIGLLLVPGLGRADKATSAQVRILQNQVRQLRAQEKADLKQVDAKYKSLLGKDFIALTQLNQQGKADRQAELTGEKALRIKNRVATQALSQDAKKIEVQRKLLSQDEQAAIVKFKAEHDAQAAQAEAKLKGLRRQLRAIQAQGAAAEKDAKNPDTRKKVKADFETQVAAQKKQIKAQEAAIAQMEAKRHADKLALLAAYDLKRKQLGQKYRADVATDKGLNAQAKVQEQGLENADNSKLQGVKNQKITDDAQVTKLRQQYKADRQEVISDYQAKIQALQQQIRALKGASGGKLSKGHKLTRTNHRGY
jgi:hypothetical protein